MNRINIENISSLQIAVNAMQTIHEQTGQQCRITYQGFIVADLDENGWSLDTHFEQYWECFT